MSAASRRELRGIAAEFKELSFGDKCKLIFGTYICAKDITLMLLEGGLRMEEDSESSHSRVGKASVMDAGGSDRNRESVVTP